MNITKQLNKTIKELNSNNFIKAHDIFEDLWREYKNDSNTRGESFILKAFVNAAVCIELYNMKRFKHSNNIWNTYKKYEYLIQELDSENKPKYQEIKALIYKKREEFMK
ncbi:MAG: DUF309 domain-containing protein [Campylobacterota bacterium]